MKTLQEILNQEPVKLHNWQDSSDEDIFREFDGDRWAGYREEPRVVNHAGEKILFASYGTDNYSGDAFLLFTVDDQLFEVNGSHCSCFGLEGQWVPEETEILALAHRLQAGSLGRDRYSGNEFAAELEAFIGI